MTERTPENVTCAEAKYVVQTVTARVLNLFAPCAVFAEPARKEVLMPRTPKNKALVVGIGTYPAGIDNLPAVASDVREIGKVLGSKNGQFAKDTIETLTNRQAKRKEVLAALRKTFRSAAGATIFVYLAGHGDVERGNYYFVTHDAKCGDLGTTAIPLADIKSLFDASPSSQAFLWLDFCHSGGILARSGATARASKTDLVERTLKVVQGQGKVIIAACTEHQNAHEDTNHGLFTEALLRGLRGDAEVNGEVTVSSLYDYIDRNIGSPNQRPMLFGKMTGRIVLMHYDDARSTVAETTPDGGRAKSKSGENVVRSSGKWTLLGEDLFFEAQKVTRNPEGMFLINVRSTDPALDVAIQTLSPQQFRGTGELRFAHQNNASTVRVRSVSSESTGRAQLWSISLEPVDQHRFNAMNEMSFSDGTHHYSANDIAELRARHIRLDERVAPRRSSRFDVMPFVAGDQHDAGCPIREVYQANSGRKTIWPRLARLKAIAVLKETETVEHVLELAIQPRPRGEARIVFRGQRASHYHNESPHVISLDGICKLG